MIIAICAQDTEQLKELSEYVDKLPDLEQMHYLSAKSLLRALRKGQRFDFVLLDLEITDKDGLEIARIVRACQPKADLILMSSQSEHVTRAFSLRAAQFFLKPITEEMFRREMERLVYHYKIEKRSWCVHTKSTVYRLEPLEVIYIKSESRHLVIQTKEQAIEVPGRLAAIEKELEPYGFARCHQGYMVNLQHIHAIVDNEIRCSFGRCVPVSHRMRARFEAVYAEYRAMMR